MKTKAMGILSLIFILGFQINTKAQGDQAPLKLSGSLLSDQRFILNDPQSWAWNENRLSLKLDKKISGNSKFHSELWFRNMGTGQYGNFNQMTKQNIDPFNLEIREAYMEIYGFLSPNLDLKIGRQRIAWGTADKLNPTDNLNPYDLEDVLDFGRHRGSDAISANYYFNSDFSLQAAILPFYQATNMPVGMFAGALMPSIELPNNLSLAGFQEQIILPEFNLRESPTAGLKFKGFAAGFDFSLSYVWGREALPLATYNVFTPIDTFGNTMIQSEMKFPRTHIFGADIAGNIGGIGVWAEAAAFLPENELSSTNDLSKFYPQSPVPVTQDTLLLKKELSFKYIVGMDYHFANNSYINFQYLHGFMNETGRENLNDYFFIRYEMKFLDDKLCFAPIGGAFIVSDWSDVNNNYDFIYMPELSYQATDNSSLSLSAYIFEGKGSNIFTNFNDYDMVKLSFKYDF